MIRSLFAAGLVLGLGAQPLLAQTSTEPPAATEAPAAPTPPPAPVQPEAFRSAEAGFAAFADAARRHDERRLLRILGEAGRRLVRSGDPVADRAARDRFAESYAQKHEILTPAPNRAVLQVGDDEWPLPIPMIQRGGAWRFDARQGTQEIIDRRIGRNELDTIQALYAIVEAQDEYAATVGRQGAFRAYARRFFSTPGTHDGLFWATGPDEPESPLGPLAAAASTGGYGTTGRGDGPPQPFHGYLFRILESQGEAAQGGAVEYVVNGRMIGGFGVLAVPAQYGVSGIQSFIVNHRGVIYERDLGPDTARVARGITSFNPEPGWTAVTD
ncbi:DUF2950 domain-containing protein [Humitalea sp. 24SJ18S-53]|uniref:DUF2950 domain-containing protein n=1 Tax=Humitalea sp. 24SJ18S-53 TaxID=3422307 RepID=UPI003D67B3C2